MKVRRSFSILAASALLTTGAVAFADGGDWSGRFWGIGWGDGYHAPPRQGWLHPGMAHHAHGAHGHAGRGHVGDAGPLMPGGYPYRAYEEPGVSGALPEWLWDPSEPEVVVETIDLAEPQPARTPDLVDPSARSRSGSSDRSLGLPPTLEPTGRTDPRAMNRRVPVQAGSYGYSR